MRISLTSETDERTATSTSPSAMATAHDTKPFTGNLLKVLEQATGGIRDGAEHGWLQETCAKFV